MHDSDAMLVRDMAITQSADDNTAERDMENVLERLSLASSRSDTGSRASCEKQLKESSEEREVSEYLG